MLFYPQIEKNVADAKQEKLIQAFEQLNDTSDYVEPVQINDGQIEKTENQQELLDGARGVIKIPEIDLEMMIFEGSNQASLRKGVGMIEPEKDFSINNIGLAGHRGVAYGKQFNRLNELEPNDEIEIKTKTGVYEFVIVETFIVDQTEVEVLNDKKEPLITLVTCTPIGKADTRDRLIVQAKLKQKA